MRASLKPSATAARTHEKFQRPGCKTEFPRVRVRPLSTDHLRSRAGLDSRDPRALSVPDATATTASARRRMFCRASVASSTARRPTKTAKAKNGAASAAAASGRSIFALIFFIVVMSSLSFFPPCDLHRLNDIAYYKRRATDSCSSTPLVCCVFVRNGETLCRRSLTTQRDVRGRVSLNALIKSACVKELDLCRRRLSQRLVDFHCEGDTCDRAESETRPSGSASHIIKKRARISSNQEPSASFKQKNASVR